MLNKEHTTLTVRASGSLLRWRLTVRPARKSSCGTDRVAEHQACEAVLLLLPALEEDRQEEKCEEVP
jgi:hypothetical protein